MGEINNAYVVGFDRNVRRTVEVLGGKMRSKVQLASGDLYRKEGVYQRVSGGGLPSKRTNRFGDSPVSEQDYSRRRVTRQDFEDGQFMDWSDIVRISTDLQAQKLVTMMNKFKRQEDIIIQQALLGTAKGGDNGETDVPFVAGNILDVQLGASSGNAGFTYEKLTQVLTDFGNDNVDIETNRPCIVISYNQWNDMMKQDEFINSDFTGARPIDGVPAMIRNYMGCDFLVTNIVPFMNTAGTGFRIADSDLTAAGAWADTDSTDIRACFAFVQDAALLEINPDVVTKMSERADKGFNWYAYIKAGLGAVRMEDEKVRVIPCDQSPA
jgi:hypothetical protein